MPGSSAFVALHAVVRGRRTAAGLDQNIDEIARQAVLLLDQQIRHNERGAPAFPLDVLVSPSWVDNEAVLPTRAPSRTRRRGW